MKLPVYSAAIALLCGVLLYAGPALLSQPLPTWSSFAFGALLIVYASSMGRTVARLYRSAEERWASRSTTLRTLAGIAGALLVGGASQFALISGADAGHMHMAPALTPFLVGLPLLFQVAFNVLSAALVHATRRVRHVRTRMEALAMSTALMASILALVLRSTIQVDLRTSNSSVATIASVSLFALITVLLSAGPVRGFTRLAAGRLSASLQRSAEALGEVGRGNLDVQLPVEGQDEIAQMGTAFNAMVAGLREKSFLEEAFGRYASPAVLAALREAGGLTVHTARREATVLYADVRGFTAWSESVSPEEVMRALNLYFERIVQVVEGHGGYVNKFIGDAIMVIFGAPHAQPDHAARAVACARGMQTALAEMNRAQAFGTKELQIGIGVNTGPLVAGTLGSERRAEYTVIGDTVNVAARLTSNARPGEILVGAATAQEAGLDGLEPIEPLKVKGKAEPLEVYRARELTKAAS
ncbi:MAG: HAMP domain-containing protein [Deltaproteobacteria bacterium]|nr:HAMP domain-containing protein [Deltaproteobacteria bacterium]